MFLDVSPKVFELQRRTVPHFKAKVIIYNSFYSHEAPRWKLGLLHTKKSVRIICIHPLSAIYLFLCAFYAILRCKSFKIRVNFLIELLKIYKNIILTSFLDLFQPPSMRISLVLHLNFVHIKPQQPNLLQTKYWFRFHTHSVILIIVFVI